MHGAKVTNFHWLLSTPLSQIFSLAKHCLAFQGKPSRYWSSLSVNRVLGPIPADLAKADSAPISYAK